MLKSKSSPSFDAFSIDKLENTNVKAGKANAAIALKDIAQLVEHQQKDDQPEDFKVNYPEPFGAIRMTPATIPTAFVFSKLLQYNRMICISLWLHS